MSATRPVLMLLCTLTLSAANVSAQQTLELRLQLQTQRTMDEATPEYETVTRDETWPATRTAVIVCDVWDYHHCLNAVRRLEQFLPRLDEVLAEARRRGAVIIHAPSDCMDAYKDHAARSRATNVQPAAYMPHAIESWCSVIPREEHAAYPIDQSDGGEDDDPQEHAAWAAKLESIGRNPKMPWQEQHELITIDEQADYITDRGDEVWNILAKHDIQNVILTGVHTNMCVLGRPFGLRQMARNGKNVVLMRDMTDTMYNPQRWPYVSHFEGTRRVIAHIERFVCPTITSDQLIGGEPFRFAGDSDNREVDADKPDPTAQWVTVSIPPAKNLKTNKASGPTPTDDDASRWYRCVVRMPDSWLASRITLNVSGSNLRQAWINGNELTEHQTTGDPTSLVIPREAIEAGDANLMVLKVNPGNLAEAPQLRSGNTNLTLAGLWQLRIGEDPNWASMPLPAKFGGSAEIVFSPEDQLWTPRAVTRPSEFTHGIEGPACDRHGNIFAVNFAKQGTIGRVRPHGIGEVFVDLPSGSIGNGIRFAPDGSFFVADYTGHNVLRVDPGTREVSVHAHHDGMNQPNDLAISPDGKTLFASDPNWSAGTGNLWRIDDDGSVTHLLGDMGTTNGIEVSPDGKTLYVNESKQRNVWAFTIDADNTLREKRLVRQFDDHAFDGMRCDVDGNLYITRYGKGTVVKMTPRGKVIREIPVLGNRPSNLCFGGPDRRTVYVTEVDSQRIIRFRVDRPGRE